MATLLGSTIAAAATPRYYYDAQGRLLTATTAGHAVVNYYYDAAGNRSTSQPTQYATPAYSNILNPGEVLFEGEYTLSSDSRFMFTLQTDGNIVLYQLSTSTALWSSGTSGTQGVFLVMQGDGNLVMYGPDNSPLWSSGTSGHPGAGAVMQTDGNFVVDSNGSPNVVLWQTGTGGH